MPAVVRAASVVSARPWRARTSGSRWGCRCPLALTSPQVDAAMPRSYLLSVKRRPHQSQGMSGRGPSVGVNSGFTSSVRPLTLKASGQ
jgi:hypothetical protein